MKCLLVRWWLDEYLDGTLRGARWRWVHHHLQQCPSCGEELRWRRTLEETLRHPAPAPSADWMWQDFANRLAQRKTHVSASHRYQLGWSWAAATTLAALILVTYVARYSREQTPQPNIASRVAQTAPPQEPAPLPERAKPTLPPNLGVSSRGDRSQTKTTTVAVRKIGASFSAAETAQLQPFSESMIYAEVRNEQGELVARLLLHTDYDSSGRPAAVQIEYSAPATLEVLSDEQPTENPVDTAPNTERDPAVSPEDAPTTRLGVSD